MGTTSLHSASYSSCPYLVKLLIEKGAKVSMKDNKGKTPIALALHEMNSGHESLKKDNEQVYHLLKQALFNRHHAYVKEQSELLRLNQPRINSNALE